MGQSNLRSLLHLVNDVERNLSLDMEIWSESVYQLRRSPVETSPATT